MTPVGVGLAVRLETTVGDGTSGLGVPIWVGEADGDPVRTGPVSEGVVDGAGDGEIGAAEQAEISPTSSVLAKVEYDRGPRDAPGIV